MAGRSADRLRRAEPWVHPGFGPPGGDFTEQDEANLVRLATLTSAARDGLALRISRDRDGGLNVTGRAWQEDGTLSARYWNEAAKERRDPASIFYF